MSHCSCWAYGLLAILLIVVTAVDCSQYSSNMFLNGEYENGLASHSDSDYVQSPAATFLSLISKRATPFVGPEYLPTLLECRGRGQQCVPKNECKNGYFTQQLRKVQNCAPEDNVCCTYNPPTPPPTAAPTTPKRFITCSSSMACVAARDCRNGEILSNAVINLEIKKCYEPSVCCAVPSTMLTEDGYVLKTPPKPFTYPQPPPKVPTTPIKKDYLPPQPVIPDRRPEVQFQPRPQPQSKPRPQPQPRPQPLPQKPEPQVPAFINDIEPKPQAATTGNQYLPPSPQPTKPQYSPPTSRPVLPSRSPYNPPSPQPTQLQPARPQYNPPTTQPTKQQYIPPSPPASTRTPIRQPQRPVTRPTSTQPPRRIPSTSPPKYLPPVNPSQPKYTGDREVQPSNQENRVFQPKPIRGEAQLSPQIFPTPKFKPLQPLQPSRFKETFVPAPAKCASALMCVAENYCSSIGVISESPVEITPFRVPLTDCIIEETGAPGKCCRDPNYVDPWPVNLAGVCATRNKNTKPPGIKDIDANFAEIPWQAMILKESTKSLLCGGAIIGDGVVLTTASCVQNVATNDIRVKAGEWELGSTNEPLKFQLVGVKDVAVHPSFDANTGSNDMAVLHLTERLQFASHIQPICISDKDPTSSETCVTTGWGKQALSIHEEGAIMHVTSTSPVSRSDCGADSSAVCSTTKFDACEFDAGSALACGTGSSVLLKGIYNVENACGEGQAVRFTKPDVAWVNKQFLEGSKPLLLRG